MSPHLDHPYFLLLILLAIPIVLFPRMGEILPEGAPLEAIAFPVAVLMGVAFAGLIPTGVSLAQRTMPHRTSLVSGMMLGGSWAAGAWGPDFAQTITSQQGLRTAFDATLVYVQVTRGAGPRSHETPPGIRPTVVMTFRPKSPTAAFPSQRP